MAPKKPTPKKKPAAKKAAPKKPTPKKKPAAKKAAPKKPTPKKKPAAVSTKEPSKEVVNPNNGTIAVEDEISKSFLDYAMSVLSLIHI